MKQLILKALSNKVLATLKYDLSENYDKALARQFIAKKEQEISGLFPQNVFLRFEDSRVLDTTEQENKSLKAVITIVFNDVDVNTIQKVLEKEFSIIIITGE